jgi:uncharacterized protein (DUF2267 family)
MPRYSDDRRTRDGGPRRYGSLFDDDYRPRTGDWDDHPADYGFAEDDGGDPDRDRGKRGARRERDVQSRGSARRRSRSGLPVFDKTMQMTHIWLNEICDELGPDKQHAWKVLAIVLHTLRDRLQLGTAAHLGAQLPILVRGLYYDQFAPGRLPTRCDRQEFMDEVAEWLSDARPTDPRDAVAAVFRVLSRHIPTGEIAKVQDSLPRELRAFWFDAEETVIPPPDRRRDGDAWTQ